MSLLLLLILCQTVIQTDGTETQCHNAGQCFNLTFDVDIDFTNDTKQIECYGLGSCFHSSITKSINTANETNTLRTKCRGKRACQNLHYLDSNIRYPAVIDGYLGLGWTKNIDIDNNMGCFGEGACYKSHEIIYTNQISAYGYMSAADIYDGFNVARVKAWGSFAFKNSFVYSASENNMIEAEMYGFYSGYNSTIYCKPNHTCKIYCQSNGCENMNFICNFNQSHCFVSCDQSKGIICPNGWQNGINNISSMYTHTYSEYLSLLQSLSNLTDAFTFLDGEYDDYISYSDETSNKKQILDNFDFECNNNSDNSNNYKCSNFTSCHSHTFNLTHTNNSNICCSGMNGCFKSVIMYTDRSSSTVDSVGGSNIYCDGYQGCSEATMILDSNLRDDVYCRGKNGCMDTSIQYFNKLICGGHSSCQKSDLIANGEIVLCNGYRSCFSTVFTNITYIIAGGHLSLENSNIISGGNDGDINVYLLGYQSAVGLNITCDKGDKCTLYCLNEDICNDIMWYGCNESNSSAGGINNVCGWNRIILNATVTVINSTSNYNYISTSSDETDDDSDNESDPIGEIEIVIENINNDDDNYNFTGDELELEYYNATNETKLGSRVWVTFFLTVPKNDIYNMIKSNSLTTVQKESNKSNHKLNELSTQITNIFVNYFDNNATDSGLTVKTTIHIIGDSHNVNSTTPRLLLSENTYSTTTTPPGSGNNNNGTNNEDITLQVDTIIIIEDEIITNENSSYFVNISDVFFDILNITKSIFNTTSVDINDITIHVTIVQIVPSDNNNNNNNNNDNSNGGAMGNDTMTIVTNDEDEKDDNVGFWTAEMVVLLVMISITLCVVSCFMFCCIVFCCTKRKGLSDNASIARKNLSIVRSDRCNDHYHEKKLNGYDREISQSSKSVVRLNLTINKLQSVSTDE